MSFVPFGALWIVMAAAVLALLAWRKAVSLSEDDNLHVLDGGAVEKSAEQIAVAQKLDFIDRWGKIVTIVAVVYGVVLGGVYMWHSWIEYSKIGM